MPPARAGTRAHTHRQLMPSLLHHNTFGIDANCEEFAEYGSVEELRALLPRLAGKRWMHIGAGSNLLFAADYPGTVLHSLIKGCGVTGTDGDSVLVTAGAGMVWDDFVARCVDEGWHGLENLSHIPGEVGASAVQNVGAYGVEAGQHIHSVSCVDAASGAERVFTRAECGYAYRSSVFKHALRGRYIVTSVTYRLSRVFSPDLSYGAIRRAMEERGVTAADITPAALRSLVTDIRRAKLPEPAETGSAGSFFVNPVVPEEKCAALLAEYPEMPHYIVEGGVKIPAGWMIEQCGWKGRSLGAAGVYAKQALVLVNLGGATGADIVRLSDAVRADVLRKFGVEIHPEVNIIQ
jgi:UDP-N-acetylmuramate dehydrogenase